MGATPTAHGENRATGAPQARTLAPSEAMRFRNALARFATGVTVVGHRQADGSPRGVTVNAFASVSLDPPLVLVSIARAARSHDLLAGKPFSVNVLKVEQEPLARHFAGETQDLEIRWVSGVVAPRLAEPLAWLECEPWAAYDGGDHTLYVGRVVDFLFGDGDALGFYASRFVPVARPVPSQPPVPFDPFELPYDAL
jgi:flavin reductase (DIM6/NTAB) family NADH-FMN oxidoreductase RutF